jgi:hypothetical protein
MEQTIIPSSDQTIALLGGMPSVEAVRELESHLITLPQVDLGTTHMVHGGMYARTIRIPAGTVLTGALTNCDNICILCGDITVTTDDGPQRLTGYHVIPAKAGAKRVGATHADTWWTTLWPTALTDVDDIENELTDESDLLQTRRSCIEYSTNPFLEKV